MIHKYWNVRLHAPAPKGSDLAGEEAEAERQRGLLTEHDASEELRTSVRKDEEAVEYKVHWIWQTLSTFEEKSATCISDMLLHVSNGAYMDGVVAAKKFITHVDILFAAADELDHRLQTRATKSSAPGGDKQIRTFEAIVHPGLSYSREAKLLCKKVVAFFQLLAESQDHGVRRLGVTQELLSLVTGLAHYLKLMIRICLSGALKLERETGSQEGLEGFLGAIGALEERVGRVGFVGAVESQEDLVDKMADTCAVCDKAVEDKCFRRDGRVLHAPCLGCGKCGRDLSEEAVAEPGVKWSSSSSGRGAGDSSVMRVWCEVHAPADAKRGAFVRVSRLRQYVHLLRVAHARLLATLRSGGALPHTSDDPNLLGYDNSDGRHTPASETEPPLLRSNTRSRSYAGRTGSQRSAAAAAEQGNSSYEDAMGDIRRLRSTRMDKQLSNAGRHARKSRIIDGPEGLRSGSPPNDGYDSGNGYNNGPASALTKAARRTTGSFQIVEDRDPMSGEPRSQLTFGGQDTMTLDDIPRIVQAQQTREQRPNASRFARGGMMPQEPRARLVDGRDRGHGRDGSGGEGMVRRGTVNGGGMMGGAGGAAGGSGDGGGGGRMPGTKRYFSELTALEYFIVRHVAVLSMEPLLEGHFNQEELLELIETKRPTFWSKFGKAFQPGKDKKGGRPAGQGNGASSPAEKEKGSKDSGAQKIFGVPLETLLERDYEESTDGVGPGTLKIPSLVQEAISAMKTMDMSVEGVFRKNGNIKRLNDLKEEVDARGSLEGVDLTKENPVQVAALLKKFLRELPDPLLLHKLHKLWITSQRIQEEEKRRRVLHLTCCLLPKAHRDTLEVLCTFLQWVSSFCQVDEESGSKMDVHNLATVITPNILAPWPGREGGKEAKEQGGPGGVDESFLGIEAVCSLIECNEAMCEVSYHRRRMWCWASLDANVCDI